MLFSPVKRTLLQSLNVAVCQLKLWVRNVKGLFQIRHTPSFPHFGYEFYLLRISSVNT